MVTAECPPDLCTPPRPDARGSQWTADWATTPDVIGVSVSDEDTGELVHRETVPLEWRRTGGSERCGGPLAATVSLPAPDDAGQD